MSVRIITLLLALGTVLATNSPLEASPKVMALLESNRIILNALRKYTESMEKNVEEIKKYTDLTWKIYNDPSVNYNEFLSHPINAHILLRRAAIDADEIFEKRIKRPFQNMETLVTSMRENGILPNIEELQMEVSGLVALQYTYGLDSKALSQGFLQSPVYNNIPLVKAEKLTETDSIFIFAECIKNKYVSLASEWNEIRQNLKKQNTPSDKMEEISEPVLPEKPGEIKADQRSKFTPMFFKAGIPIETESEQYIRLCRGERLRGLAIESELMCWKFDGNDPFYLLQPLKLEELSRDPFLCIIYDVINDTEIDIVRNLKINELKPAMGVQSKGISHLSSARISYHVWIESNFHPIAERLNRRLEMITGLSTNEYNGGAEKLQLGNYATGGLYVPHYDYFVNEDHKKMKSQQGNEMGDRIATFMYYLSDVPSGGATVFPLIGATVWPKKGSGVFWWNLKANGEQDNLTKHGACPVLFGSKWVGNRWIRTHAQMFRKKCLLEPDAVFHDL